MLMGRYENKHALFARRKCENSGWSQGRTEARGSWSFGEGRIRGFLPLPPSVKPPGFSTVLLLG